MENNNFKELYEYYIEDVEIENTENDLFHNKDIAEIIKDIVIKEKPPFNIGVFGRWGTGKSSIVKMIFNDKELNKKKNNFELDFVNINVWKYSKDELRRVFLQKIIGKLDTKEVNEFYCETEETDLFNNSTVLDKSWKTGLAVTLFTLFILIIEQLITKSNHLSVVVNVISYFSWPIFAGVVAMVLQFFSLFNGKVKKTKLDSIDRFENKFKKIIEDKIKGKEDKYRLIVFVDDLDRCPPKKMVEVVETLKTFFETAPCIFIVACDDEILKKAINEEIMKEKTKELIEDEEGSDEISFKSPGEDYIEKLFHYIARIPPYSHLDIQKYAKDLIYYQRTKNSKKHFLSDDSFKVELNSIIEILIPNTTTSPRKVKKLINDFSFMYRLCEERIKTSSSFPKTFLTTNMENIKYLAKMAVIRVNELDFYYDLIKNPLLIDSFTNIARNVDADEEIAEIGLELVNRYFEKDKETNKYVPKKNRRRLIRYLSTNHIVNIENKTLLLYFIEDIRLSNIDSESIKEIFDIVKAGSVVEFNNILEKQKDKKDTLFTLILDKFKETENKMKENVVLCVLPELPTFEEDIRIKNSNIIIHNYYDIFEQSSLLLDFDSNGLLCLLKNTINTNAGHKIYEILKNLINDKNVLLKGKKKILNAFINYPGLIKDINIKALIDLRPTTIENNVKNDSGVIEKKKIDVMGFTIEEIHELVKSINRLNKNVLKYFISSKTAGDIVNEITSIIENKDEKTNQGLELNDDKKAIIEIILNECELEIDDLFSIQQKIFGTSILYGLNTSEKIITRFINDEYISKVFNNLLNLYNPIWEQNSKNRLLNIMSNILSKSPVLKDIVNVDIEKFMSDILWNTNDEKNSQQIILKMKENQSISKIVTDQISLIMPPENDVKLDIINSNYEFYVNINANLKECFGKRLLLDLKDATIIKSEIFKNFWMYHISDLIKKMDIKFDELFDTCSKAENIYRPENKELESNTKISILRIILESPDRIKEAPKKKRIFRDLIFVYLKSNNLNEVIYGVDFVLGWYKELEINDIKDILELIGIIEKFKNEKDIIKLALILFEKRNILKGHIAEKAKLIECFKMCIVEQYHLSLFETSTDILVNNWKEIEDNEKTQFLLDDQFYKEKDKIIDCIVKETINAEQKNERLSFYAKILIDSENKRNIFNSICILLFGNSKPDWISSENIIEKLKSSINSDNFIKEIEINRNLITVLINLKKHTLDKNAIQIMFIQMLLNDRIAVVYLALDTIGFYFESKDLKAKEKTTILEIINKKYDDFNEAYKERVKNLEKLLRTESLVSFWDKVFKK